MRPSEVIRWPAWELDLVEWYLSKQPSAEERIEIAVATLATMYANAHKERSREPFKLTDYLPYLSPDWNPAPAVDVSRYDEVGQSVLKALGAKSR